MTKAKDVIASLTEEQKLFFKHKTISDTKKIKEWIRFLVGISRLDQLEDGKREMFKKSGIASLIISVVFIFLAVTLKSPYYLIGTGASIIIGILLFYIRYQSKKRDVSNYLRLFFLPILKILQNKAGADANLAATLDFKGPRNREPVKSRLANGRKQSLYSPTYILARVQLLDAVKLSFGLQEEIKDQTWTKTNMRGKVKYKGKTKTTHQLLIKMSLPKSQYSWNGTANEDLVIEEKGDHYEAKKKMKLKRQGDNSLSVDYFFRSIEAIYNQFTALHGDETRERPDTDDDQDEVGYMAPYVWHGAYFDQYDYDSVDYQDPSDMSYEDAEGTVFDS